ncbi:MAG: cadherin repeat domain-containing protein [Syntrophobacterales bacterium]|nr:MAG: cadherin repeat domain-containing protein [Syntrophobacterales bacterium]
MMFMVGCTGEAPEKPAVDNNPPSIQSIEITPEDPYTENELRVEAKAHDPDGDAVQYWYQWMRNGRDIPGANGKTLTSDHFRKGDSIFVKVVPSDGKLQGEEASSDPIQILNSTPEVTTVAIDPELPRRASTLKARVEASDPDGDTIAFSYQWVKNGNVLIREISETLRDPTLRKGDKIILRVSPYDMESTGEEMVSQEIVILNSAPNITSSPKAQKMKSTLYRYQVVAEDPDDDPITFSLSPSSPQGMTIDPETGLIQWRIGRNDEGTHTIEIIATDGDEGRCTQKYTLNITTPRS